VPDESADFFEQSLEAYLSSLDTGPSIDEAIDPATEQRLEELGYL
jgi:hypothetical protein